MKFKDMNQLLKFVLFTCSGMEYDYDKKNLIIYENFNLEKVLYADILIKKRFGFNLNSLRVFEEDIELPEGFLENMNIKYLMFNNYSGKLPKLPDTLISLNMKYGEKHILDTFRIEYGETPDEMKLTKNRFYKSEVLFTGTHRECLDYLQNLINSK